MSEQWQSPLLRAHRVLGTRLVRLELAIGSSEGTPQQWEDYLRTLDAFLRVRTVLGPDVPARIPPSAIRR